MKITVSEKTIGCDGWVFLPIKNSKGRDEVFPKPVTGLPIRSVEWEALSEASWQDEKGIYFKAAPIDPKGKGIFPFQEALGKALKFLSQRKAKKVAVVLPKTTELEPEALEALFEVPDLMMLDISPYKTKPEAKKTFLLKEIVFISSEISNLGNLREKLRESRITADAINFARRLSDEPANVMNPQRLVQEALTLKKDGLKVRTLEDEVVRKMGGVQAVSAGSDRPPEVIFLELNPGKARPIVLVGKGVTFDSGGICIKPAESMWEMKGDMAGAAAILGAMKALANLGCTRRVIAIIPAVENMPDGKATRPGDVIRIYDGQTVEILNTDAEGRLILADALAYANEFQPECVIDLATLTGAIIVALGSRFTGLFCNDEKLREVIEKAAREAGDLIWNMPLHPTFLDDMKSQFADWKNSGGRKGGACLAAAFLSAFVKCPWAHLDIAGSALQEKERPFCIKGGASGVGVKILVKALREIAKSKKPNLQSNLA